MNNSLKAKAKQRFTHKKKDADVRGLEFTLDVKFFEKLIVQKECSMTGIKFIHNHKSVFSPSIERIDNKKGYTPDNVTVICRFINDLHNVMQELPEAPLKDASEEDFSQFVNWYVKTQNFPTSIKDFRRIIYKGTKFEKYHK